ncbi:hypothetical protein GCM10022221_51680 [Actinocorallia aurea]
MTASGSTDVRRRPAVGDGAKPTVVLLGSVHESRRVRAPGSSSGWSLDLGPIGAFGIFRIGSRGKCRTRIVRKILVDLVLMTFRRILDPGRDLDGANLRESCPLPKK